MLLIAMEQIVTEVVTFGNEAKTFTKSSSKSFASRRPLAEALQHIMDFKIRFNAQYSEQAVDYRLLTVSTIDELSDELRKALNLQLAETL